MRALFVLIVAAAVGASCSSQYVEDPGLTIIPDTGGLGTVVVTPTAFSLAVGKTVQLTLYAQNDLVNPLSAAWMSSDATKVSVSPSGLVTAIANTQGVSVCGTATVNQTSTACSNIIVQ